MEKVWPYYFTACAIAYLIALWSVFNRRAEFAGLHKGYFQFLLSPWKLASFILAASFMTFIAPYTGDPTWDYADAFFMSSLTYITAPWAVGVIYRAAKGSGPLWPLIPAVCAWHFSASFSYDAYILITMKIYPPAWAENMAASSFLYGMAGLMWNVEWSKAKKLHFAFQGDEWPPAEVSPMNPKVLALAGAIAILTGLMIVYVFILG